MRVLLPPAWITSREGAPVCRHPLTPYAETAAKGCGHLFIDRRDACFVTAVEIAAAACGQLGQQVLICVAAVGDAEHRRIVGGRLLQQTLAKRVARTGRVLPIVSTIIALLASAETRSRRSIPPRRQSRQTAGVAARFHRRMASITCSRSVPTGACWIKDVDQPIELDQRDRVFVAHLLHKLHGRFFHAARSWPRACCPMYPAA